MLILCMIILIFFAIIGLCAFITAIADCFYSDSGAVLLLTGLDCENAEARIRAAERICRQHRGIRLKCVCDENDPVYDICVMMQKEYPMMEITPCEKEPAYLNDGS